MNLSIIGNVKISGIIFITDRIKSAYDIFRQTVQLLCLLVNYFALQGQRKFRDRWDINVVPLNQGKSHILNFIRIPPGVSSAVS